jgi:hypothetical protein
MICDAVIPRNLRRKLHFAENQWIPEKFPPWDGKGPASLEKNWYLWIDN